VTSRKLASKPAMVRFTVFLVVLVALL